MIYSSVIEKRNRHCKKIDINHLIILCEIGEDYKSFCDDLERLVKSKSNRCLVSKVYQVMQGKLSIGSNKYKKFIEKHKHTIEIMKKYSRLGDLTVLSYDEKGKRIENLDEDYFYNYIQEHTEDIETIKAVVLKIKNLGFDKINFGEKLDFTGIEYKLDTLYESYFSFLENMQVIPTYLNSPIKYKTNGSCYRLNLKVNKVIDKYDREIELNSLIFDPNRLPNEITAESTIDIIKKLSENKKEEHEDIRNSIDLSITTSDITNYFECLKKVAERINKTKDNQELMDLLNKMQDILVQLQSFGVNFENQVIASHLSISDETMEREKKLYLDRRHWVDVD